MHFHCIRCSFEFRPKAIDDDRVVPGRRLGQIAVTKHRMVRRFVFPIEEIRCKASNYYIALALNCDRRWPRFQLKRRSAPLPQHAERQISGLQAFANRSDPVDTRPWATEERRTKEQNAL